MHSLVTVLLVLTLVAGTVAIWFLRRKNAHPAEASLTMPAPASVYEPKQAAYRPDKVGNDASARPWEHGDMVGAELHLHDLNAPPGFDVQVFIEVAKSHFLSLQSAWDRCDMALLRAHMTDGMLLQVRDQLQEREERGAQALAPAEVSMLQARVLGVESLPQELLVNVEFSGLVVEDASAGPSPFREIWSMVKPVDSAPDAGADWLVAGVQALQ